MSVVAGRVMPLPRGAWDSTTEYHLLDIVSRNGSAYMATDTSTGIDPSGSSGSSYWMLIVSSQTTFAGLTDVQLTNLANGQIPIYDATSGKWKNGAVPAPDISGKADKVTGATNGNLAKLDANGNLVDSGVAADAIHTGTLGVNKGGTGRATLDSGKALIGDGTNAVALRAITDNTTAVSALTASTNLVTMNTLKNALNRATAPTAADTDYGTYMVRAMAAGTTDLTEGTSALTNGVIYMVYE